MELNLFLKNFYNILLKGCKEAFKAIELKEFLYTDEAMEDNKEYFISKESIEQIGINRSNNLIVNYQIEKDIKIDYVAMKIPNDFIVGYGLDYDGYGRNLKDIYTVVAE